jgi:hypothetical protein
VAAECISPIQGVLARIVRLDECGAPVTGTGSLIVFDGFMEVQVSPQYEDGTTYQLRKANGSFCINRRGNDQFTRDELNIRFCAVDPDAVVITTGQELITTGAPATGTGFWVKEGDISARWSFELWQADGEAACEADQDNPRTAYWAWPHLAAGRLMDFTVGDDVIEWRVQARSEKANTLWGAGPGAIKYINQVPADAHRGFNITSLELPETTGCGAATLPAA